MKSSMKKFVKGAAALGVVCVLAASAKAVPAAPDLDEGFAAAMAQASSGAKAQAKAQKELAREREARPRLVAVDLLVAEPQYDMGVYNRALGYRCDPFAAQNNGPRCTVVTALCQPSAPALELNNFQAMTLAKAAQQGLVDADAFFNAYYRTCDFNAAMNVATPNVRRAY